MRSVNDTFKGQLDLERHGGHTPGGVIVRVLPGTGQTEPSSFGSYFLPNGWGIPPGPRFARQPGQPQVGRVHLRHVTGRQGGGG